MKDTMGIVFTHFEEIRLNELSDKRSISAMPIGGRYRLIDFALSNLVNSGIINVGVATRQNYSSLLDHVGSGKPWGLNRKNYGLFIHPPFSAGNNTDGAGNIDALFGMISYLRRSTQKYVILAEGNVICNTTFDKLLEQHIENHADVSLMYHVKSDCSVDNLSRFTVLEVDEAKRVTEMQKNPRHPISDKASMGIILMERKLLIEMTEDCISRGKHDIVMHMLIDNLDKLRIFAFPFKGYVGQVDSIHAFFENNMALLRPEVRHELFSENVIYTKDKDSVPTRYLEGSSVKNSLIADGCVIEGDISQSVVFRGVKISRGAKLKNCIIMQNTVIEEGVELENVILDKECVVRANKRLIGQEYFPVIVGKRTLI